ncbi:MAG: AAA family ATPase [Bacteroidales bacterium]|nr:AAA family ATPase [Bacteroidales bacterium]
MSRQIFLPELLSINIKNYTLYPNGLDYTFDFIKGVNLVLGGNGMGKTTFVNLIKYALIGNYKNRFDFRRTYLDKMIQRRQENSATYFSNRMDASVITDGEQPFVELSFRIHDTVFHVKRDLLEIKILSCVVNGETLIGEQITQSKYEKLSESAKKPYLLYKYEKEVERCTNITFDDLIVFVNEVLFFGEDHKTIMWNNSSLGSSIDVQDELFNKYFNDPKLDEERQEALRQARYYDSLSRHRSEDMRAIKKVLDRIDEAKKKKHSNDIPLRIINLKEKISNASAMLIQLKKEQRERTTRIETLENEINLASSRVVETERKKAKLESLRNSQIWETVHPSYYKFERNIRLNHVCPLCNKPNEALAVKVEKMDNCFVCGSPLEKHAANNLTQQYREVQNILNSTCNLINEKKREISRLESEVKEYDSRFEEQGIYIRNLKSDLRELQYVNSQEIPQGGEIQPFLEEMERLQKEKESNQQKSIAESARAAEISNKMVAEVTENVLHFSSIFSSYAEQFLGVDCKLTYTKLGDDKTERFYPVIAGITRQNEEELSESQRFFIDHSFRMTILTFFYQRPTFYIVETPDSSLDISYEHNAAKVFLRFLDNPNSIIITSNLNNSTFLRYLIEHSDGYVDVVGLLDIAKQSMIQNSSEQLKELYIELKEMSRNEQ